MVMSSDMGWLSLQSGFMHTFVYVYVCYTNILTVILGIVSLSVVTLHSCFPHIPTYHTPLLTHDHRSLWRFLVYQHILDVHTYIHTTLSDSPISLNE